MSAEPGRLRVYLGAAPGVGKTVAMLHEGRRLRDEGHDVVIGLIEAHGRAETLAAVGDLEVVPRRQIVHRGVTLAEMDVDAILARRPEIALVDELAHTNAPGSPRPKRWDDVQLLLAAGIDVLTTLNVQHLESLRDLVESITGARVSETVPDAALDDADVQLVDLPVEELIARLERGKIYPEATAKRALANFFREGNLTALRELSLRRTAAGVDEHLDRYMRDHHVDAVWPAAERVLALLSGPEAARTLRRAWRLASGLRAELVAAVAAEEPAERTRLTELAEDFGASVLPLDDAEPETLIAAARAENAGLVVIPAVPGLAERLARAGEAFDIVIAAPGEREASRRRGWRGRWLRR